jgi:hypothetical protein
MSVRYDWIKNNRLFVVGFPSASLLVEQHVQSFLELMRRTHNGCSFVELVLTPEENEEMAVVATRDIERSHGMVVKREGTRLTGLFRRFGGEEYEVEKEYRAFLLGEPA